MEWGQWSSQAVSDGGIEAEGKAGYGVRGNGQRCASVRACILDCLKGEWAGSNFPRQALLAVVYTVVPAHRKGPDLRGG